MSNFKVEVKNLTLIFGKNKKKALEMLDKGKTIQEIRKETKCAVAVNDVSFNIEEGELFVIVGLSGSGKSSLIRCMNLLNEPTLGKILVDGDDITTYNKEELRQFRRKKVAMVFQHFGLLNHRNVISNVEFGLEVQEVEKEIRTKKALEAIEVVGLKGWEQYMPNQLSGGMKQRVGLARALANEPELLLMDEPFSALDPLIRREMQLELLGLEDYMEKTIVFITHDMNEAFKMGDRIALLKDGNLVQIGTPKEFFENPADEYVESFIEDVDKSRIIKVKNIMRKPAIVANINDNAKTIYDKLVKLERDFCYVTDEKNVLKGYVELDELAKCTKVLDCLITDYSNWSVNRNTVIKDIWSLLDNHDHDVAIIDKQHHLRGVVNHSDVVSALA